MPPRSLLLCLASFAVNEWPNATTWHKVSLFPQLPHKERGTAIRERESETESNGGNEKGGNESEGNVYLFRHNGEGICVHESYAARVVFVIYTRALSHTRIASVSQHVADSLCRIRAFCPPKVLSWPGFTTVIAHYADELPLSITV